jgi:hypothetical protein
MPIQILLSLIVLAMTVSTMLLYFLTAYRDNMGAFLGG